MPVNSLADYKPLFKLARKRGVKIQGVVIHPVVMAQLWQAIWQMGENPLPYQFRTWKRFWRKPDARAYLFGVPVMLNPSVPPGHVRIATLTPMPPDLAEKFMGGFNLLPNPPAEAQPSPVAGQIPNQDNRGALQMLSESVNRDNVSLADLLVKSMDGIEGANGVVVLRFYGDRFDITSNFNPLECQAVIQRTAMRIMAGGMEG